MERVLPVKTIRADIKGDYEGWWCDIRTNPPAGPMIDILAAIQEADEKNLAVIMPLMYKLLLMVVQAWNFVDEQGKDLPVNLEGMRLLPTELIIAMADTIQSTVISVPLAKSFS